MERDSKIRPYRRLEDVEDVDDFASLLQRSKLTKNLDAEHPYCIFSFTLSDEKIGFVNRNNLGLNMADFRRAAEEVEMPLILVTPFYAWTTDANVRNTDISFNHIEVESEKYDFNLLDSLILKTGQDKVHVSILEKKLGSTTIVALKDVNFGEFNTSSPDQKLYQAVVLGFGGYAGLKFTGLKPSVIQLTDSASCFAALARLDELVSSGMNFYEAMVYTRKHTVFVNKKVNDDFKLTREQVLNYVLPNLESEEVKTWLLRNFADDGFNLSLLCKEMSELKITTQPDFAKESKIWRMLTDGVGLKYWSDDEYYKVLKDGILDNFDLRADTANEAIGAITAKQIVEMKSQAKTKLNKFLGGKTDQNRRPIALPNNSLLIYLPDCGDLAGRLEMLFDDSDRLADLLGNRNAYLLLSGQLRQNDKESIESIQKIFERINSNPVLKRRVQYIADETEDLVKNTMAAADICLSLATVRLNNFNWMRAIANFCILVAASDGDLIDTRDDACLVFLGEDLEEETESLYMQLDVALASCTNDFDLEYWIHHELDEFIGVISATRMVKDYLQCVF